MHVDGVRMDFLSRAFFFIVGVVTSAAVFGVMAGYISFSFPSDKSYDEVNDEHVYMHSANNKNAVAPVVSRREIPPNWVMRALEETDSHTYDNDRVAYISEKEQIPAVLTVNDINISRIQGEGDFSDVEHSDMSVEFVSVGNMQIQEYEYSNETNHIEHISKDLKETGVIKEKKLQYKSPMYTAMPAHRSKIPQEEVVNRKEESKGDFLHQLSVHDIYNQSDSMYEDPSLVNHSMVPSGLMGSVSNTRGTYAATLRFKGDNSKSKASVMIVLTAVGLMEDASSRAIEQLPYHVLMSIAPVARNPSTWADLARGHGHSVLTEVPMESQNTITSKAVEKMMLATSLSKKDNLVRLERAVNMVSGSVGMTPYLGDIFLSDSNMVQTIMRYLKGRGMFVFDSDPMRKNDLLRETATDFDVPYIKADMVIDETLSHKGVYELLKMAEPNILRYGSAGRTVVISAAAFPHIIDGMALWIKQLHKSDIQLVDFHI